MEGRLKYKLEQLESAVKDFNVSLDIDIDLLDPEVADSVKSGRAQKYELCAELLWKTIKVYLQELHGIDENSPKSVIKAFYSLEYVNPAEYEFLIEILNDRNQLSHVYNKEQFEVIYNRLIKTMPHFQTALKKMR